MIRRHMGECLLVSHITLSFVSEIESVHRISVFVPTKSLDLVNKIVTSARSVSLWRVSLGRVRFSPQGRTTERLTKAEW